MTRADEFLGTELVKVLTARGHHVFGLTASVEAAQDVRRAGAVPVIGDLFDPGRWQDEVATDWVFHLPPDDSPRSHKARRHAESIARRRLRMDEHLLDAAANGVTRRIVYVDDTSRYETQGCRPITEDEPLTTRASARALTPVLNRVDGHILAGLPLVTILPGRIYGNGSWLRDHVIEPIMDGRRVLQFGKNEAWVSPIHVHDCARALVHLAEHGTTGGRYFVVNSEPVRMRDFARTFAYLANRSLRVWPMPAWTARFVVGSMHTGGVESDAVFANIRLRGTGFQFRYATLEEGLREIVSTLRV